MQQHGSKYFARRPLPDPAVGSIGQKSTFSEQGHVAYQIKENHECSNMVANILPADPSLTLGMGSIGQYSTFSEHGPIGSSLIWVYTVCLYT